MVEERTIDLTLISATDLKKCVKIGRQTCYATAYIYSKQRKKTRTNKDGGNEPAWNETLRLTCDEQQLLAGHLVITVEIYSAGTLSDKLIGSVTIPVSDIAKDAIGVKEAKEGEGKDEKVKESEKEHAPQYLAFEVHRKSGKTQGVLNVAIKFGEKRTIQTYQSQPQQRDYAYGQSSSAPATGYPPAGYPNQYPPQPYGAPAGYPPQQGYYPQQPAPYYPQQQPVYYQQQPPPRRGRGGGGGLGFGAGLLGGALGGFLVADAIDDIGDYGDGGDFGGRDSLEVP
ncbi:hypothetical protein R1sor_007744 [Riccia sorocarpa]|uniref:C2 domain-containing protein n=1 Tax=Riccia sorocarpa TaxID=122646 RepID=A0ABD3HRM5_9MARC